MHISHDQHQNNYKERIRHLLFRKEDIYSTCIASVVFVQQAVSPYHVGRHETAGEMTEENAVRKISADVAASKTIDQLIVEASGGTDGWSHSLICPSDYLYIATTCL